MAGKAATLSEWKDITFNLTSLGLINGSKTVTGNH